MEGLAGGGIGVVEVKYGGKLGEAVGRLGRNLAEGIGDRPPPTAFEQVTRERVDGMTRQLDRLELKLNGVFLALLGAVVTEIYRVVVTH